MLLIGLTGGIGSGKSTVAAMLAERGAVVVDADKIAREVVEPGEDAYDKLVERFGPGILTAEGHLDRPALAAVAFADAESLAALNAITHPAIQSRMSERVAEHRDSDSIVVLDIPLLEIATRDRFALAAVVVVDAPVEVAVSRLVGQRGMAESDARARIAAQKTREERRAIADQVIDNGGTRHDLEGEVARVWTWVAELAVEG
jgi:dephospho-CoA kinase